MDLSPKALRFLIEAVEYRMTWYQQELDRLDLSDDQRSDLTNDHMFFGSILEALQTAEANSRAT